MKSTFRGLPEIPRDEGPVQEEIEGGLLTRVKARKRHVCKKPGLWLQWKHDIQAGDGWNCNECGTIWIASHSTFMSILWIRDWR